MNNIKNLEHSLTVINNLGATVEDILEQKKNEVISTGGGVTAATEVIKLHKELIEKTKSEFTEKVKNNALAADVANLALTTMSKSHELLTKFLSDKTAQNNMKKGEVLAYDAQVKLLKSNYDSMATTKKNLEDAALEAERAKEAAEKAAAEEAAKAAEAEKEKVEQAAVVEEAPVEKKKRGRKRPDEIGKLGETVKRLKDARKKRTSAT